MSKKPAVVTPRWLDAFPSGRFAQLPLEVLLDTRLQARHLKVYAVLCLHAGHSGYTSLSAATLSEISGVSLKEISKSTTALEGWGYLMKKQQGFNDTNAYQLSAPDISPEFLRVVSAKRLPDEEYETKRALAVQAGKDRFALLGSPPVPQLRAARVALAPAELVYVPDSPDDYGVFALDGSVLPLTRQQALRWFIDYCTNGSACDLPFKAHHKVWERWGFTRADVKNFKPDLF